MKKITVSKAIGEALHEEMLRDKNVFICLLYTSDAADE